ncbi:hypothetical protein TRIUR3_12740 [Triticum urartu]|uniref:Uncharacterized protein n=1 Tax=Triticum urartu TaxID=4572 RepID=M7ZVU7_TRIUA|nr:hypothetical protein TRIUR3_12740 [Triticum urartu]
MDRKLNQGPGSRGLVPHASACYATATAGRSSLATWSLAQCCGDVPRFLE